MSRAHYTIAVAAAAVLGACGGAAPARTGGATASETAGGEAVEAVPLGPTVEEQATIDGFDADLGRLGGDLDSAMELANCGRAGELRDAICDLADRICDIARRHPSDPDLVDRCAAGRDRCTRARDDVGGRCG